jgi:hypothetical protein
MVQQNNSHITKHAMSPCAMQAPTQLGRDREAGERGQRRRPQFNMLAVNSTSANMLNSTSNKLGCTGLDRRHAAASADPVQEL